MRAGAIFEGMESTPRLSEGKPLSLEEFEKLPDGDERRELVRGCLVREPPAGFEHGRLAARIAHLLLRHIQETSAEGRGGAVLGAETGFVLSRDPPTVRAPDVAFVSEERLPPRGERSGFAPLPPDLAVEIVSPSNRASEVLEKVLDYLQAGCRSVWIVDPRARAVTVYRSRTEMRLLTEGEALDGGEVLPGFRVRISDLFE